MTFGALLPIVNPLSTVPVVYALSGHMSDERRAGEAKKVAIATFVLAIAVELVHHGVTAEDV